MNSVIVVSRNLDRIYEEGSKRHCISLSSSSGDSEAEFIRKKGSFLFFSFQVVCSKLILLFILHSLVFRSLCSILVRER